jgi:hypothetical protein
MGRRAAFVALGGTATAELKGRKALTFVIADEGVVAAPFLCLRAGRDGAWSGGLPFAA